MSYTRNSSALIKEQAMGNGNCAFNALILAVSSEDILNGIENELTRLAQVPDHVFAEFIQEAALVLGVAPQWAAVKTSLLQTDRNQLQLLLAPTLRRLAIHLAEQDPKHIERTKEHILSAFEDYVRTRVGIKVRGDKDDIYNQHLFIMQQFEMLFAEIKMQNQQVSERDIELYNQLNALSIDERTSEQLEQLQEMDVAFDAAIHDAKEKLLAWWEFSADLNVPSRYRYFLSQMKEDGQWAGDLELYQLARYFHVNLNIVRGHFTHVMHFDQGVLPLRSAVDAYALLPKDVDQLVVRGIVERPVLDAPSLRLLPLSHHEVKSRLNRVPDYQKVNRHIETENAAGRSVRQSAVPPGFSAECRRELLRRDVISRRNNGQYQFADVEDAELKRRIDALGNVEKLEDACQKYRSVSPTVNLSNQQALHWDSMHYSAEPVTVEQAAFDNKHFHYQETLKLFNAAKFNTTAQQWNHLVDKAKAEPKHPFTVQYTLPGEAGTIEVSRKTQIELDEELAKELQREECERYVSKRPK